uniref:Uncharacterized protein n=1 Tax=Romanomermis culicivorax TaxID=13658 RepID=A0A915IV06_ROMCU
MQASFNTVRENGNFLDASVTEMDEKIVPCLKILRRYAQRAEKVNVQWFPLFKIPYLIFKSFTLSCKCNVQVALTQYELFDIPVKCAPEETMGDLLHPSCIKK